MGKYIFGWKAIQAYLNLSRQTIIKMGYPVRKLGESVCADSDELDAHFQNLFREAKPVARTPQDG